MHGVWSGISEYKYVSELHTLTFLSWTKHTRSRFSVVQLPWLLLPLLTANLIQTSQGSY